MSIPISTSAGVVPARAVQWSHQWSSELASRVASLVEEVAPGMLLEVASPLRVASSATRQSVGEPDEPGVVVRALAAAQEWFEGCRLVYVWLDVEDHVRYIGKAVRASLKPLSERAGEHRRLTGAAGGWVSVVAVWLSSDAEDGDVLAAERLLIRSLQPPDNTAGTVRRGSRRRTRPTR